LETSLRREPNHIEEAIKGGGLLEDGRSAAAD